MSEDEAPTGKLDYNKLMKFKLNQRLEYKGQQCTIIGWSTNGDGDRKTGVGTSFKYKLDKFSVFVQERDLLIATAAAAAAAAQAPAPAEE
jgi:hypothetical protein